MTASLIDAGTLDRTALEKASKVAYSEFNYPDDRERPDGIQGAAERIIRCYLEASGLLQEIARLQKIEAYLEAQHGAVVVTKAEGQTT
jgi:hypothetical protein